MQSSSSAAPLTYVNCTDGYVLAPSEDFGHSNPYLEIFGNLSLVYPLRRQIFNQNISPLLNSMFTNIMVTCASASFLFPLKYCKVKK